MKSSLLAVAAFGVSADNIGEKVQCLGPRAHLVTYDIKGGDTLDEVTDASITVTRDAASDDLCASNGPSGDQAFCFGSNTDETCTQANTSLPITDNFECSNCFAGVTTDLYYKFETKLLKLERLEVGVQNTKITGALEVHAHGDSATDLTSGTISLPDKPAHINFMAGAVPVNLTISLPTHLDYSLGLKGQLDAVTGANVDVDFGNHFLSWNASDGFVVHSTPSTVNLVPVLSVDTGDSGADIGLSLASSLQVNVDKVFWYHINAAAGFPSKLIFDEEIGSASQVCLKGDVDFPVNHEAKIYKTVFGHDVTVKSFGPVELLHYQKVDALKECVDVPIAAVTV